MLFGFDNTLKLGDTTELVLMFENREGGEVTEKTVTVDIVNLDAPGS